MLGYYLAGHSDFLESCYQVDFVTSEQGQASRFPLPVLPDWTTFYVIG